METTPGALLARRDLDQRHVAGAVLRAGGVRDGATYAPTVLTDVPAGGRLREEVFGPVPAVVPVDGVDGASPRSPRPADRPRADQNGAPGTGG